MTLRRVSFRTLWSPETRPYTLLVGLTLVTHIASFFLFLHLAAGNPAARAYPIVNGDSIHYAALAENLRLHGEYFEPETPLTARVWPPGYPFLMAITKALTGSYVPLIALQVAFAAVAVALIYRMALRLTSINLAWIAAALYALEPMAVFLNTSLYTDGLFSSLLVITTYIALFQSRMRGPLVWGGIGLLLGVLAMIKPIALYLLVLAPIIFIAREYSTFSWRKMALILVVFFGCAGFVVAPWMVRNHRAYGVYEIAHASQLNLLRNFARPFLAWRSLNTWSPVDALLAQRRTETPAFVAVDAALDARLQAATPPGEDSWNYQGRVALEIIFGHPVRYAYFHAINMIPFFLASSASAYEQYVHQVGDNTDFYAPTLIGLVQAVQHLKEAPLQDVPRIVWGILPILAEITFWFSVVVLGVMYTIRRPSLHAFALAGLILYFAALTGPIAMARYRVPVTPYLFILAAAGLSLVLRPHHEKAPRRDTVV